MFQNTRNRSSQSSRVCPRDVNGHGRQGMDEKSIERKAKKTCWGQEAFFSSKSRPGLEKLEMGRRIAGTGQNLINVGRTYHKLMSGNRSYITTHQFHKFKYVHTFQFQFLIGHRTDPPQNFSSSLLSQPKRLGLDRCGTSTGRAYQISHGPPSTLHPTHLK